MVKELRSLSGVPVPVERQAGFTPHNMLGDGVRTDTPAARESVALLARRSRGHVLGTAPAPSQEATQPA